MREGRDDTGTEVRLARKLRPKADVGAERSTIRLRRPRRELPHARGAPRPCRRRRQGERTNREQRDDYSLPHDVFILSFEIASNPDHAATMSRSAEALLRVG